jgi:hypothetical protein
MGATEQALLMAKLWAAPAKWFLPFIVHNKNFGCISHLSHVCYM